MRESKFLILVVLLSAGIACSSGVEVAHETQEITFRSNHFRVAGELKLPKEDGKHPVIIMVHGDGPAYRRYFPELKECMLRAGYATLMWDKPGFGESEGEFSRARLRQERAEILVEAIEQMKAHPDIDAARIGVWGISQAGVVIPMALEKTDDISFLILVGCPGQNGIRQTAYLIGRQLEFAGYSEEERWEAENHFIELFYAESFEEYIEHARPLYENPVQRDLGFVSALWDKENWRPHSPSDEGFYDPMEVMDDITIPALVFYGEKDTQVDPLQGMESYEAAFRKAGNPDYRIVLISGADHNLILSETGSIEERSRRKAKDWGNYAPEYLDIMGDWLRRLGGRDR